MEVIRMMAANPAYDLVFANARGVEHILDHEDGEKRFRDTIDLLKTLKTENDKATMLVMGEPEFGDERRWKAAMGARQELVAAGVALFPDIERGARALGRYVRYLAERQHKE